MTSKNINDKEYDHVLKGWDKFRIKAMNDYHNFYLGDAFEKVINSNLRNHGLCTSHLLSKAINI